MRAKAIKAFLHSETGRIYLKGEVFEGSEETVAELAADGFLDAPGAAKKPPKEEPDYATMTVRELVAMCGERGIETQPRMRKSDLVAALRGAK